MRSQAFSLTCAFCSPFSRVVSEIGIFHQLTQTRPELVALTLVRSHVAAARVLLIGTWHTALVGLQQMTPAVSTAIGIYPHQSPGFQRGVACNTGRSQLRAVYWGA